MLGLLVVEASGGEMTVVCGANVTARGLVIEMEAFNWSNNLWRDDSMSTGPALVVMACWIVNWPLDALYAKLHIIL